MFRKKFEQIHKENELKQKCFEARNGLIVVSDKRQPSDDIGCINLIYSVECGIIDAWRVNVNPENTYRVIGPRIKYCYGFDNKNPLERKCTKTSCPMYARYKKYIEACEELRVAQKTKGK